MPNPRPNNKPGQSGAQELFTPEQVAEALLATSGLVSFAAKRLRTSRPTIERYVREYPICAQAKIDARENLGDLAESKLEQAIKKGQPWALNMYLKTIHKGRGYVERSEVTDPNAKPVEVRVTRVSSRDPNSSGNQDPELDAENE